MNAIQGIQSSGLTGIASPAQGGGAQPAKGDFGASLESAISKVDNMQQGADASLKSLASGQNVDLHGTMIELEKADIALRAMVSVRNKLVNAYEQVMNMAI
jgi:flagellar hook-basal body complex protein FliE